MLIFNALVPQIESMDRDTRTPSNNNAYEVCEGMKVFKGNKF